MKHACLGVALIGTLCQFSSTSLAAEPSAVQAAKVSCQRDMPDFNRWLQGVYREAQANGISKATLTASSPYLISDAKILWKDQHQGVFNQSWLKFSDRMVSRDRLQKAPLKIRQYKEIFARIEKEFGVPAEVITSFWALESDFGASNGGKNDGSILTAVTTLAYDCHRADFFRRQLMAAFQIIQNGDQTPETLFGDWAGESGGLQITPADYVKNAVDYDGDGRRDLIKSVPDTLASAANFIKSLGWKRGQPWITEVRVPYEMAWEKADLAVKLPRSEWVKMGVVAANGRLPSDGLSASLLLPMGRLGPAFLVYDNFQNAYMGWNASLVYSLTAAYLATRLQGAEPALRGNGQVMWLESPQLLELQNLLQAHGYDVGTPDGKMGNATRLAVRQAQLKLGLPADAMPTMELIDRLRSLR